MTELLAGKVAVVTGAAQGIGAELAVGLARHGAGVVIVDVLDGEPVAERIRGNNGSAIACTADVTDAAALGKVTALAECQLGGIDVLVNNAALFGTLENKPLDDIEPDEWDRVMSVNVRGVWQCVKAVVPAMVRRGGGSVVNISTNRVHKGFPNMLHYDASKGAVTAMTKAMAAELGAKKIRVNAVAPGLTMSENVQAREGIEDRNKLVVAGRALERTQQPEDLVGAVTFFASSLSGFVSGQTLIVDGGGIML